MSRCKETVKAHRPRKEELMKMRNRTERRDRGGSETEMKLDKSREETVEISV